MNNVVLSGRLVRDPEARVVGQSNNASFTLAVDKNLSKDKKTEFESRNIPTADFIRIVVWGKQADNCVNYLYKGSAVLVNGRIQTGSYEKDDGTRVYTTDVVANNVEFLTYGKQEQKGSDVPDGFHEVPEGYDEDDIPF
jgi:single-strand DNA-binding protein